MIPAETRAAGTRAQFSLEFMLVFAAYAALVAALAAALQGVNAETKNNARELVEKTELEAVCAILDVFSTNARNTAAKLEVNSSRYAAAGDRTLTFAAAGSNASAKCFARIRGGKALEVEEVDIEAT